MVERFFIAMGITKGATAGAALFLTAATLLPQAGAARSLHFSHQLMRHTLPWVEGVTPPLENRLFDATYKALPSHNVVKVYAFDAGGFESAGIRFSARVPHTPHDLTASELDHEAVSLIRTTFERFPQLQTLDVWATIPIPKSQATTRESTVFSVSADRAIYESIRDDQTLSDAAFLAAFGRVWVAPEVPQ